MSLKYTRGERAPEGSFESELRAANMRQHDRFYPKLRELQQATRLRLDKLNPKKKRAISTCVNAHVQQSASYFTISLNSFVIYLTEYLELYFEKAINDAGHGHHVDKFLKRYKKQFMPAVTKQQQRRKKKPRKKKIGKKRTKN